MWHEQNERTMHDIIVIDDTGLPGSVNESRFLKSNRKTWVAVLIKKEIREELNQAWFSIIKILREKRNVNELHFTDLINKVNEFADFDNEEILELLDNICELLYKFDLPYFIQTSTPKTLKENGVEIVGRIGKKKGFDIQKTEDLSLILLYQRIKSYADSLESSALFEIVLDEGRKRAGTIENVDFLKGYILNDSVKYESSKNFLLLQIADFYAYGVNRSQQTMIKDEPTEFDINIFNLFNEILQNGNVSGGEVINNVNIIEFSKDDYDYHQRGKRQIDGNLDRWIETNSE